LPREKGLPDGLVSARFAIFFVIGRLCPSSGWLHFRKNIAGHAKPWSVREQGGFLAFERSSIVVNDWDPLAQFSEFDP
jgi:hypothetical protein